MEKLTDDEQRELLTLLRKRDARRERWSAHLEGAWFAARWTLIISAVAFWISQALGK